MPCAGEYKKATLKEGHAFMSLLSMGIKKSYNGIQTAFLAFLSVTNTISLKSSK